MSVIAIVGAGPGLGAAVAQRFGREGFSVALISRNRDKLATLGEELTSQGVTTKAYVADIADREAVSAALQSAAEDLGDIEVLQFSPVPGKEFLKPVLDTTVEDLRSATELSILGFATAVRQVLPGMMQRGTGTLLLINGSSAATPNGRVAGTSTAFAGESAYGAMLHEAAGEKGVHVHQLIIPGAIGGGDPLYDPASLAERIWGLHAAPGGPFRATVGEDDA